MIWNNTVTCCIKHWLVICDSSMKKRDAKLHPSFQRHLPSRQNARIIGPLRQDKEESAWKTHSNRSSPPAQAYRHLFDTASVSLMECLGRTGLDFAIIDNEHSPIEAETTAALVRASELSGICPLARVREISRPAVLKLLDVGVQGLIVPNVKTLAQVQELVNYAKYYPIGQRGFCPSRKDGWGFDGLGSVPETMRHFNGETLLFPQCETAEALAIIEDICAVDGVDGIFVGPFDLSISMGMPGQFDAPEFQAAVTRIVAACRAAGKYCMFFTGTADGVIDGFRRGFDAMAYSLDAALFIQSVKRDVEDIRSRL
ncbi:MAG: HpcH/HpaI aldolase family protein [Oscillospiraceae bacterium]